MSTGKPWAYTGMIVGATVSVAANVAHSFVPPEGAGIGWSPQFGAVLLAAFWPLALLLAIEVLAKVAWPGGRWWAVLRFGGVTPVAAVAAIVSYRHLSGLLGWYGEDPITVAIGPAAVDGLMVVSTAALLALASTRVAPIPAQLAEPNPTLVDPIPVGGTPPSEAVVVGPSELAPSIPVGSEPVGLDRSVGPSDRVGSGPVGSGPSELGRPAALHLVSDRVVESVGLAAKVTDVERARQAIKDGKLPGNPPTAEAIRRALNVGLPKARAIRAALAHPSRDHHEA